MLECANPIDRKDRTGTERTNETSDLEVTNSPDGRLLAADVFVPKDGAKRPVVLIQTPYNKELVRPWFSGEGRWGPDLLFTDSNYAFVIVDWRGKFGSA